MESTSSENSAAGSGARRLRVIVVDDQSAVCEVVSDVIRSAGHEVVATAANGVEAVTRAAELRPDLVVMDISMPQMNGVEAMRNMLAAGTARRVALMSGEYRSLGITDDQMRREGAAAFLAKPFNVGEVFELLDKWSHEL
jgi:two-component system chemotaxis response regulator CheY